MKEPVLKMLALLLCFMLCGCGTTGLADVAEQPGSAAESSEAGEPPEVREQPDDPSIAVPEVNFARETADAVLEKIFSPGASTNISDEEKIRLAYVYLIENTYFADPIGLDIWFYRSEQTTPPSFNECRSLSPLLFGVGSCEDFACAMVILLEQMGFAAMYVPGYTISVEGDYVDHAWTAVELDGLWYHLDPQLEQNIIKNNIIRYRYFLKSDRDMLMDHKWGENLIEYRPDISLGDAAAIRERYAPPACPESAPQVQSHEISLPRRPDLERLIEAIEREKHESPRYPERDKAGSIIEPPVLIHEDVVVQGTGYSAGYVRYGREFLSAEEKILYDRIYTAASDLKTGVELPVPWGCTPAGAENVIDYFMSDNPRFYWLKPELSENGALVILGGTLSGDEISARERELETMVERFWEGIPPNAHPADAVAALHDRLATAISYDTTHAAADNANIYGGLVLGRAVCDGFSRSLQYLLQQRGMECVHIRGTSPRGAPHSWNAVKLDDGWYYTDVTWDAPQDKSKPVPHDYLNITREEMSLQHYYDAGQYPALPESGDISLNYYAKNGYAVYCENGAGITDALAGAFVANLRDQQLSGDFEPVFLEIKVFGTESEYRRVKDEFVRGLFVVLGKMREIIEREGLPIQIKTTGSVDCNFNDAMQILILFPSLKLETGYTD